MQLIDVLKLSARLASSRRTNSGPKRLNRYSLKVPIALLAVYLPPI